MTYRPGIRGQAIAFDGLGTAVQIKGFREVNPRHEFTVELWFNRQSGGAFGAVLAHHSDTFSIRMTEMPQQSDRLAASSVLENGNRVKVTQVNVKPEMWHHVGYTFSVEAGSARLYVDGELTAEASVDGPPKVRDNDVLTIGSWFQENEGFAGLIDEMRIYDEALGPAAIAQLATASNKPDVTGWVSTRDEWKRRKRERKRERKRRSK